LVVYIHSGTVDGCEGTTLQGCVEQCDAHGLAFRPLGRALSYHV
jgi:hypothetical protein